MSAIEQLRSEHMTILRRIDEIEKALEADELRLTDAYIGEVLDFIWHYVERNHHAKEERALFARMQDNPVLQSFAQVLHEEHEQGAALVLAIERAADEDRDAAILRRHLLSYVAFLRDHIARENEMIFPAIENALEESVLQEIEDEFRAIEADAFNAPGATARA